MSRIYFCVFCPQKYIEKNAENIRKHLKNSHLMNEKKSEESVDKWIDSLVNYETELNHYLDLTPKQLPENSVQKLMIGCKVCDRIIESFQLKIESKDKRKCVCGKGSEEPLVIGNCIQCKQFFHYECIESKPFSGQDLSSYECINCKPKNYEICELMSERLTSQRVHCHKHLFYEPFICKMSEMSGKNGETCNQRFYWSNFIESHLRYEHKLDIKIDTNQTINELKKYYKYEGISLINQLIDGSVKQISNVPKVVHQIQTSVESIANGIKDIRKSLTKSQNDNNIDLNESLPQMSSSFQSTSNKDINKVMQKSIPINGNSETIPDNKDLTKTIEMTPKMDSRSQTTHKRKLCDTFNAKNTKEMKTINDESVPKPVPKKGRGRPRKTTPSNDCSTEVKPRIQVKPVGSDSNSDWDSETEKIELGLK